MADKIKGNLVVGQSGGPTAVINSSLAGVLEEARRNSQIREMYGMLHGIEGVLNENLIDLKKEEQSTIRGLTSTPSAALGSCRHKLSPEDYIRILSVLQAHDIRYFFYIGGNDSMDTSHQVSQVCQKEGYELRAIGIPKTIDNDLEATDHSPGYGSVARWVATSTMEAGLDTAAIGIVDKVKVIEVMGRDTGWITAATTLGKRTDDDPPHLIYVPELPFDQDKFAEDVKKVYDRLGFCVITACEGLKDENGKFLVSKSAIDADAFGHKQLGGVADHLCQIVSTRLGLKARFDKPGTIQRVSMALASKVDLKEAYMVGQAAVRQATNGETDKMITLVREPTKTYRCTTSIVELDRVANATKLLPREFINADGNGTTEMFQNYATPLIGDPLPEYVKLNKIPVPRKIGT
jgi:6-phosphofructokinase 1